MPGVTRSGSGPAWAGVDFNSLGRAWYSRTIQIPETWRGRAIELELTRLSTDAIVYANGKECGRIGEGFGTVDITDAVEPGQSALITIFVMAGVEAREVTQKMGVGVGHETKIKVTLPMAGINGDAVLHSRPQGRPRQRCVRQAVHAPEEVDAGHRTSIGAPGRAGRPHSEVLDEKGKGREDLHRHCPGAGRRRATR
jgi:beta-galactosidase